MKAKFALGVALLVGAGIGAAAIEGIHAQTKPPTYVVVAVRKINDPDAYKTGVVDKAAAVISQYGGRFVIRTDKISGFDGTPPQRFVLLQFDSPEKAQEWHSAMKDIDATRMKTTDSLSFMAEGMAAQ